MAHAYKFAAGDEPLPPAELNLIRLVERFGAQTIYGRPLSAGEVIKMITVERIINAYESMHLSKNWAQWAKDNPIEFEFLMQVKKAADE